MLNDSRNNSIRSNMKRYCSCRERQCTDNKWLWNFAPALTREQYNVRWCNSWREAVIGQENHLSWNYTVGSIQQDHFFSFSVSVPILFAGSLCVCPYPSICFSQRYVCFFLIYTQSATCLPQWAHCLAFGCGVPSLPGTHPQCPLSCNTPWHWWMNRTLHTGSLYHCV